jgi:hypothetical protein
MRLESLVCGLLISINYLIVDFLYPQRGLESRPCREILYIRCTHIMRVLFCVFRMSIHWRTPPPPHPPIPQGSTQQKPWRPYWRFRQKSLIKILLNWNTNMTKCNTSKSEKNKEIKIYVIIFHWQFQRLR